MMPLEGAELVLGLPVVERASTGACAMDEYFGSSMLWWPTERAVLSLPDFYFGFTLALREPASRLDVNELHSNLLYQYMYALHLAELKAWQFEASLDGDRARRLDAKRVLLSAQVPELVTIEALLGKAQLQNVRALFEERSHGYRRRNLRVDHDDNEEEDLSQPMHPLFEFTPWPKGSFESNDAFASVYTVKCRNHVVAATVIAALLPYAPIVKSPTNPLPDDRGCGTRFLLGGKHETRGYLVRAKGKTLSVIFRGASVENTAVNEVTRQLGLKEPVRQAMVVSCTPAHFGRGAALLLAPVDAPQNHPIFSRAVARPCPDLLVSVRVQPSPSVTSLEEACYNCNLLRCGTFTYMGELGVDCTIEHRFGVVTPVPRAPAPRRHAGGIEGLPAPRKKAKKRRRDVNPYVDDLPRDKRARLVRDTLEYQRFLRSLRRAVHVSEFVVLLLEEGDFIEVLSYHEKFEGLSNASVSMCRDVALKHGLFPRTSSVAQRFDAYIAAHPAANVRYWVFWWLRDTLEYQRFLRALCRAVHVWEFVLLLLEEGDFIEVLSTHEQFEGLSDASVSMCRDVAIKLNLFPRTSSVAQRFDGYIAAHPAANVKEWVWWWE